MPNSLHRTAIAACITAILTGHLAIIPNASAAAPATPAMSAAAKSQLELALACTSMDKGFAQAEAALKRSGWRVDQGDTPVSIATPLKIYGFETRKIDVFRDGGEHIYRSYLPGVSLQQVVKAAKLRKGNDGVSYGRVTKLGVLTVEEEGGETTLTCTVDTEGAME